MRISLAAWLVLAIAVPSYAVIPQSPQAAQNSGPGEPALRERVQEFFGLLQAGRFSEAEKYLTDDSKESFRYQQRSPFLSFEIKSVKVAADGKSAAVEVLMQAFAPQLSTKPLPMPSLTRWQLVDGTWYAVIPKPDPDAMKKLLRPSATGAGTNPAPPPVEELKFKGHTYTLGVVKPGQIKTARFPFTNVTDHVVTITKIDTGCDCLKAKTEKKSYKPGESGELTVDFDPTDYSRGYIQSMVFKTDPGGVLSFLTIKAYVMPPETAQPTADSTTAKKP
ncbi:MAG: DUF1573 domain-containing protein [Acidobacteriia bacterium]|nr:DUF1573 domain-containing protein [Terriglobia bacterium]